jgi:hypothetical protein
MTGVMRYPYRAAVSYKNEPFRSWTGRSIHFDEAYDLTTGHAHLEKMIADDYLASGLTGLAAQLGLNLPYNPSDWRYAVQERKDGKWVDLLIWSPEA